MAYAGDISALDCWKSLESNPAAQLVDVRSTLEWQHIGVPDLSGIDKQAIFVEWQSPPLMQMNPDFVEDVVSHLQNRKTDKDAPVFMLCRSGARSMSAAMALTARGYTNVFNVEQGFEGDADASGQRGRLGGWQFEKLPSTSWEP